jgi:hypothetical protein
MTELDPKKLSRYVVSTLKVTDFPEITNPKYIGPGVWLLIHQKAALIKNKKDQLDYIMFIKDICENFPCKFCRGHCKEYIEEHPLEDYIDVYIKENKIKQYIGLFIWSWKFHNAVNERLRKPLMDWDTAYAIYVQQDENKKVCSKSCTEASTPRENINIEYQKNINIYKKKK